MNFDIQVLLQVCCGLLLFVTSVKRLGRTDTETIDEIRRSIFFVTLCSMLLMTAPFLPIIEPPVFVWEPYTTPIFVWLALACSFVCIQFSTFRHWQHKQPRSYVKDEYICYRRERLEDFAHSES